MKYPWVSDEGKPGHYLLKPARIPQRWIPDVRRHWTDWRDGRRNMRRLSEQDLAAREIGTWLEVVLGAEGSVDSFAQLPKKDEVVFTVGYRGRRRELAFWTLRSWPGIDPRDELASDVLEALQDPRENDALDFPLGGYAEDSEMNRNDPTA